MNGWNLMSNKVQFIAEVSANHLGSITRAHQLIDASASAGATAVKFQTYKPETMTLDMPKFSVSANHSLWGGRTLYSLYAEAMTPWEWHAELFDHCRQVNVIPFSSPFDPTAVEFLESLDVPMYKVASLETSDLRLIKLISETGKPALISTGATTFPEIEDLVETFLSTGNEKLTLLVCTSSYPSHPKDANLARIQLLKEKFGTEVGISDHTLGTGVSVAAIALGASAVEKHITLNRSDGGADGAFSMEPHEFADLVIQGNAAHESIGLKEWSIQDSEMESRRLRRSLFVVTDVVRGDTVTHENTRAIRPGNGCSPKHLEVLLGQKFNANYDAGTPMGFSMVDK
jgi:N-acetylneuraminate synthase